MYSASDSMRGQGIMTGEDYSELTPLWHGCQNEMAWLYVLANTFALELLGVFGGAIPMLNLAFNTAINTCEWVGPGDCVQ